MTRRFFGTDGVRGVYGGPAMNEKFAGRLARAAADFVHRKSGGRLRRVVLGRDTRASGESLAATIAATLVEAGLEVYDAGIVPTPAVARGVKRLGAQLGIVVTASHNPAPDNGLKFFSEGGGKFSDADEEGIEEALETVASGGDFGDGVMRRSDILEEYVSAMGAMLPADSLSGWRIVIDGANGASVATTPAVLRRLGAELETIGDRPNGFNINEGVGSLYPEKMAAAVKRDGARLGLAHDGDGDRAILCDENGGILDGDDMLAILAVHWLGENRLRNRTVVATVQSNLGLDEAIVRAGGRVVRTPIGDRYVVAAMQWEDCRLGGETSGHLVLSDYSPTGDGLVAALKVIEVMQKTDEPLSVLRRCWRRFPQVTADLAVREKIPLGELKHLPKAISEAERLLGERGRVLVRYSGTEPKLRILVEGDDPGKIDEILHKLRGAAVVELAPVGG